MITYVNFFKNIRETEVMQQTKYKRDYDAWIPMRR